MNKLNIKVDQVVFLQPIGNNTRYQKIVSTAKVTSIYRKYFTVDNGAGREYTFSIVGGIEKGNFAGYIAHETKYGAESATYSNDVKNDIIGKLQKSEYKVLLHIQNIIKANENDK